MNEEQIKEMLNLLRDISGNIIDVETAVETLTEKIGEKNTNLKPPESHSVRRRRASQKGEKK